MFLLFLFSLFALSLAAKHTTPPSGALVVAKSGGKYSKIQDAVNALSSTSTSEQTIFIQSGTYDEQVYIRALKGPLTIMGYTEDSTLYTKNTVTITHGLSQANTAGGNDMTATVRAWTTNLKMYNINMVNTYGKGSQALALSAEATNQGYYACQLKGYQDTLLTNTGTQLYSKCFIEGVTDFIFGQHASTWFEQCDIRVLAANLGYITASGRDSESDTSYFVVNNSTVAAKVGNTVPDGAFYLGRPWRNYARVVFQSTSLSKVINGAGWKVWGTDTPNTDHVLFGEYKNIGDGSKGTRASFATKLSSPVNVETVLGKGWASAKYVDQEFVKNL
ncbi:putative pectin methylesterase [Delitschia confertaspora ATCC 74209]|uniref:pectinesterase n=1 Tax=Delitschia confertaspora ATCC 74209 TaxID=1513339 RepID=A0A9P4JFK7_9PLEO|nr:putative pectin methylesterase [Delitschia confertaspora ATCC 74209]